MARLSKHLILSFFISIFRDLTTKQGCKIPFQDGGRGGAGAKLVSGLSAWEPCFSWKAILSPRWNQHILSSEILKKVNKSLRQVCQGIHELWIYNERFLLNIDRLGSEPSFSWKLEFPNKCQLWNLKQSLEHSSVSTELPNQNMRQIGQCFIFWFVSRLIL